MQLATAAEALAANVNAVSFAGPLTALGILILSLVMVRGPFSRASAIIGIVTGALGILLEILGPYVGIAYALYGLLLPTWSIVAGLELIGMKPKEK